MPATNQEQEDFSMWSRRANGVKLISDATAIEIARRVLNDELGPIEVERNEPLSVVQDGDCWVVTGSESTEFNAKHPPASGWAGPLQMRISQFDGRILSYVFTFDWAKAKATGRPNGN
jgi:hypothetical protein